VYILHTAAMLVTDLWPASVCSHGEKRVHGNSITLQRHSVELATEKDDKKVSRKWLSVAMKIG